MEDYSVAGFGVAELMIILLIVIVLFGASCLAGVGAALGKSVSEFRRGVKDDDAPPISCLGAMPHPDMVIPESRNLTS